MRMRSEAAFGIGSLVAIQLATSVVATLLLLRMSPAIDEILADNVYSEEAVEEMLAVLAAPALDPALHERFQLALARAAGNVTETGEPELLASIERLAPAALEGDPGARAELVDTLQELGQVNRDSMVRADAAAQRIGYSGAWAAALAGTFGFWLGLIAIRRIRLRVEMPIRDGMETLRHAAGGDTLIRWNVRAAPEEIRQMGRAVNHLLEERLRPRRTELGGKQPQSSGDHAPEEQRRVLLWALDQLREPTLILDSNGATVAANQAALEGSSHLVTGDAFRGATSSDLEVVEIAGTRYRVATAIAPNTATPAQLQDDADAGT